MSLNGFSSKSQTSLLLRGNDGKVPTIFRQLLAVFDGPRNSQCSVNI